MLSIGWKFWFEFSEICGDECNSIFSVFPEKRTTLRGRYTEIFENFLRGNFRNFRWNGSLLGNSTVFRFSGNISRNFRAICSRLEIVGIFGSIESPAPHYYLHSRQQSLRLFLLLLLLCRSLIRCLFLTIKRHLQSLLNGCHLKRQQLLIYYSWTCNQGFIWNKGRPEFSMQNSKPFRYPFPKLVGTLEQ